MTPDDCFVRCPFEGSPRGRGPSVSSAPCPACGAEVHSQHNLVSVDVLLRAFDLLRLNRWVCPMCDEISATPADCPNDHGPMVDSA